MSFLLHTQTHTVDEAWFREDVHSRIRKLFYAEGGSTLDVDAVRGHLADLLLNRIHRPIRRQTILDTLAAHGVRLRDWAIDKTVQEQIETWCESYTAQLLKLRINEMSLDLEGSSSIFGPDEPQGREKVLVVGGAGGGKSTTLAGLVQDLRTSGTPVLPIRFDELPEEILTTTELGRRLLLPESPTIVLAGVADGAPSVLVLDQLDAVSTVSGRRTDLWSLFDSLRREADEYPNMSVIVGCREFDLEHDYRLRSMKAAASGFRVVKLQPLSSEQIDRALDDAGVDPASVPATLKDVLSIPLHLWMFLTLTPNDRAGVRNQDALFDRFWTERQRRTREQLGRKPAWTQVIDQLADSSTLVKNVPLVLS